MIPTVLSKVFGVGLSILLLRAGSSNSRSFEYSSYVSDDSSDSCAHKDIHKIWQDMSVFYISLILAILILCLVYSFGPGSVLCQNRPLSMWSWSDWVFYFFELFGSFCIGISLRAGYSWFSDYQDSQRCKKASGRISKTSN